MHNHLQLTQRLGTNPRAAHDCPAAALSSNDPPLAHCIERASTDMSSLSKKGSLACNTSRYEIPYASPTVAYSIIPKALLRRRTLVPLLARLDEAGAEPRGTSIPAQSP